MKPTIAIQVRVSDEEIARIDQARANNRQTALSRAAFAREALINESERRLRAIEALENPPAEHSGGTKPTRRAPQLPAARKAGRK